MKTQNDVVGPPLQEYEGQPINNLILMGIEEKERKIKKYILCMDPDVLCSLPLWRSPPWIDCSIVA